MNTPRGLFQVHVSRKDSAIEADRPSITLLYSDFVMPKGLARWRSGHRGMEAVPASKPNSSLLALAFQHSFSTMGSKSSLKLLTYAAPRNRLNDPKNSTSMERIPALERLRIIGTIKFI